MGRERGSKKFSFPLPRRARPKADDDEVRSLSSTPSALEWPSRNEDSSSKAHRVLGTSSSLHRSTSQLTSVPPSPGYMSITVSEASFGSHMDERRSATGTATDRTGYLQRPSMSRRASSNVLGRSHTGDDRRGSDNSSVNNRLHPQASNSTMRSHYDAKSSPLSISQQTSDSAVRDRALRRGHPPVLTDQRYGGYEPSPISPGLRDETKKQQHRKSKPARLDLSKLFPKPKGSEGSKYGNAMLSPAKLVNSPAAMSMSSEYFPRSTTREPMPQFEEHVRSNTTTRHRDPAVRLPTSPVRKFKRDQYDNAKVHVRRPPKGVQHWFDALDEDSDDAFEEDTHDMYPPEAMQSNNIPTSHSYEHISQPGRERAPSKHVSHLRHPIPARGHDTFALEDLVDRKHLTSPSQYSVETYNSLASSKMRESTFSKSNLQDSSVLSFSSSEDELDSNPSGTDRVAVRRSLADYSGDIIIGQAQAYEVRPHRKRSATRSTTLSTSTNAATIEVMYNPEASFSSYHHPRNSIHSSRRSSHIRQPSVIHEDEDFLPKTAVSRPQSPTAHSVLSARTSASAPQPQSDGSRKLMQVTAEEEALLELMRKKRAAMNRQGAARVDRSTPEHDKRIKTPQEGYQPPHRTSAFLSMEALESSPIRIVESKSRQRAATADTPPLLAQRGRSAKTAHENAATSRLRDSSASDTWSDRDYSAASRGQQSQYLPTPSEFAPLNSFPPSSPTPAASVTSPTTTDHPSPLPSPVTPGLCINEPDVAVIVASSDTSNELDEFPMPDSSVVNGPSEPTKSDASRDLSAHRRRRTASSDAEIQFPAPPSSVEPPVPKLPKKIQRHISELALPLAAQPRSRQSSVHSTGSRTSAYSQTSSHFDIRGSRHLSPDCGRRAMRDDRDSVSDDVLAAWNSLGGTY